MSREYPVTVCCPSSGLAAVAALLATLVVALASCSGFDDLQRTGDGAPPSSRCGQCHGAIYEEWRGSAHSRAFSSAMFIAHSDQGRIERCASCHAPIPLEAVGGRPLAARDALREEGVECLACHSVAPTHGDGEGRVSMAGPLGSSAAVTPHPITLDADRFRRSELCGRCHEDTLREWQAARGEEVATCQACHMPSVVRKVTQASGIVSGALVALEERLPLRAHAFSSAAATGEAVRVLASDFLSLRLAATPAGACAEVTNALPHAIPTGAFGLRGLTLSLRVDGTEAARRTFTTRPGQALAAGAGVALDLSLEPGAHRIEARLERPGGEGAPPACLWQRAVVWQQPPAPPGDTRLAHP